MAQATQDHGGFRAADQGLATTRMVRAAHVAEMDVASFMTHLGRLGIAAIRLTAAETNADLDTLEQWLQSALPTPVR
jgi:hypothetical protein